MTTIYRLLLAMTLIGGATPAVACETQPDISQLPGETAKEASERFEKTFADQGVIKEYQRETFGLENASLIYIAKVVKSDLGRWGFGSEKPTLPTAVVQPIEAIKGTLPEANKQLVTTGTTSCGDRGDGEATTASIGTLVVVFEGLPKSDWLPNGIDSIRATNARTFELLDPLFRHGTPVKPWGN